MPPILCPAMRSLEVLSVKTLVHLGHFRYRLPLLREAVSFPSEPALFAAVLNKLFNTLKKLTFIPGR